MSATEDVITRFRAALSWELRHATRAPLLRDALAVGAFAVGYYFAYRFGMAFNQAKASPFWFPDAILLSALLVTPPKRWAVFVITALPIRFFSGVAHDLHPWFLAVAWLIDASKGILAALALRHFSSSPQRLDTVRAFAVFGLFAVVLVPAAAAFAGAAARQVLGYDYWLTWEQWFIGDALAQIVITPFILYWVFGAWKGWRLPSVRRAVEAVAVTTGLLLTTYVAANTGEGSSAFLQTRFFAPVPFYFWAALRFGMFGVSGSVVALAIFSVRAALLDRGPFGSLPGDAVAQALQNFMLLRAVPLYFVAVVVEQRWAAERSLRESEQRFRSVANATPVFLWSTGLDKGCEFVNDSWLSFCGRTLQQELGNGWAGNVHPEDLMRSAGKYTAAFDARERFELEYRLRRFDGEYRWMQLTGVPRYGADGEFLGYIGSAIDVTDRRRAEETTQALAHAQRLAVMGELTALIAHEVRQPLSAIQLSAQAAKSLLERSVPPVAEVIDILADIQKYNLRADDTIGTIRSFVRKQDIVRRPVDINDAVADVFRLVTSDAGRRHVTLRGHLAPALPQALADATQLQQVLVNLIINAINAEADTPENARSIVVLTRMYDDTSVEVAVRDRGCGIPAERLPQLFESFFTTSQQGMGLGLSIVRSIVESHQGKVWAENNSEGGGATFHFTIPTVAATRAISQM